MQITRVHDRSTFRLLQQPWNALEGDHPFRCWEWVDACWQHFVDVSVEHAETIAGGISASDSPAKPSGRSPARFTDAPASTRSDSLPSQQAPTAPALISTENVSTTSGDRAASSASLSATTLYEPRPRREPFVLAVHDTAGQLVGAAPWFIEHRRGGHAVVRWFGSEQSCADYLTLLAHPDHVPAVAQTLADWLTTEGAGYWDLLELTAVDAEDQAMRCFAGAMAAREATVHECAGMRCWRTALPRTWDELLARLSKSHRKQCRRAERGILSSERATVHTVQTAEQLEQMFPHLVDLHQRRRQSLGEPGLFASQAYTRFQQDIMTRLLARNMLKLHWLTIDGCVVAIQYDLAGGNTIYSYQSGLDPEALQHKPGWLLQLAVLKQTIEQGFAYYDFLRGDEPYKAHWRASPRPTIELRIAPNRILPRIRLGFWAGQQNVKRWIKTGLSKTTSTALHR